MADSLELKKIKRQLVELLVSKELNLFAKEVAIQAIESVGTGKYVVPDCDKWARKIIAIIKEHSV